MKTLVQLINESLDADVLKLLKKSKLQYEFSKDKNHSNFINIRFKYDSGSGVTTALGKKTMAGANRDIQSAGVLKIANAIADKLKNHKEIEDIDVSDEQNGNVLLFIVRK